GVLIALDRQEKGQDNTSAVQEVTRTFAMPVISIITLANIIDFLSVEGGHALQAIKDYQRLYGISDS
ncbi:MAG: orotate phosphoribosyltransferase, partial [Methylosarcina sp.]